jgi:hypothetical protein
LNNEFLWTVSLTQSDVENFPRLATQIVDLGFELPFGEIDFNVDTGATSIRVTEGDFATAESVVDELQLKTDSLVRQQENAEDSVPEGTAEQFDFEEYCEERQ